MCHAIFLSRVGTLILKERKRIFFFSSMHVVIVIPGPKNNCLLTDLFCSQDKTGDFREMDAELSYTTPM